LNDSFPALDRRAARRNFERAAATYAGASRLESEVGVRMLERLDYVKIAPRRVLDAGSGPPQRRLGQRYPQAMVYAVDFSVAMLSLGKKRFLERKAPQAVCGDLERLPLQSGSIDLVWSNMALHWSADPAAALREFGRVLAPGGLAMFSTLGPDTLKELRAAAGAERVHAFLDMHDLGDMLVAAGFSAPVMDMEMLTLAYGRPERLVADLRASGQANARLDRRRGLAPRGLRQRLRGTPPDASFEVIYGHAWKGAARSEPGPRTIRVFGRLAGK
jgi:malonyl-CoA O-methyltransferase